MRGHTYKHDLDIDECQDGGPMNLSIERSRRGWSRAELARRAGLNASTVGLIESGHLQPYPRQLYKLARALNVPESEAHCLLEDELAVEGQTMDRGHRQVGSVT